MCPVLRLLPGDSAKIQGSLPMGLLRRRQSAWPATAPQHPVRLCSHPALPFLSAEFRMLSVHASPVRLFRLSSAPMFLPQSSHPPNAKLLSPRHRGDSISCGGQRSRLFDIFYVCILSCGTCFWTAPPLQPHHPSACAALLL